MGAFEPRQPGRRRKLIELLRCAADLQVTQDPNIPDWKDTPIFSAAQRLGLTDELAHEANALALCVSIEGYYASIQNSTCRSLITKLEAARRLEEGW